MREMMESMGACAEGMCRGHVQGACAEGMKVNYKNPLNTPEMQFSPKHQY